MRFSLFPREEDFFTLFRRQGELVRVSCDQLHEMMQSFDRIEERAKQLKEVEHEGDLVTHEIFERLNRTFITPLEREDIHDLASGLDDVMDAAEAIGSRLVLFNVTGNTSTETGLCARASSTTRSEPALDSTVSTRPWRFVATIPGALSGSCGASPSNTS